MLRILRHAAVCGAQDYFSIFTWKSWLGGWYLRVLAQVVFFALIGRLLESEAQVHFLLLGNAVMIAAMEGIWALNMVRWEQGTGTVALLVASPSSPVTIFAARGIYMVGDGVLSTVGALLVAAPLFGVELPWPRVLLVVPLTLLVGMSAYSLGIFLGGVVLRKRGIHNIIVNVTNTTLMAICGVNVPLAFYPGPIEWLANVLPLTHGLQAIREVVDGDPAATILASAGTQALVICFWLGLALFTFDRLADHGRRDGSLDYGA